MLASIFGVTGLIVWIVVIVAVIALLKGKNKTLYKSDSNRMLCGICGGIGECLNIDPTIIRLIWVVVTLCSCIYYRNGSNATKSILVNNCKDEWS